MKITKKKVSLAILSAGCAVLTAFGLGLSNANVTALAELPEKVNTFEVLEVAAVRRGAKEGIRFTAKISKDQKSNASQYGMLVIPTALVGESGLTMATANKVDIPAAQWVDENDTEVYAEQGFDENYAYYTAVLKGETDEATGNDIFPENFYNVPLTARAYVRIDGEYYYTDTTAVRSIAYVAKMAQLGGDESATVAKIANKAETKLSKAEITLEYGASEQIDLYVGNVLVEESEKVSLAYQSSNERIVTVSDAGEIVSHKSGSANVTVTLTVDGKGTLTQTAKVTVNRPEITSFDESLVQADYDSLFTRGNVTIDYKENVQVGETTLEKAFHVHSDTTSADSDSAYKAQHYFYIPGSIFEEATKAGYTTMVIEYYTLSGVRGYNGWFTNGNPLFADTNNSRTIYEAEVKEITIANLGKNDGTYADLALGFFHNVNYGEVPTDTYITELYFYGNTDFEGSYISLNDIETLTKGPKTTITYEENITVNGQTFEKAYHVHSDATSNGSTLAEQTGHYFDFSKDLIAAATTAGCTSLKIKFYTTSGGRAYISWTGTNQVVWDIDAHATAIREVSTTIELSKVGENSLRIVFYHNETGFVGDVPTDIYITELEFIK